MDESYSKRLNKKVVFDPEIRLDRICWVLETSCPSCNEPLEVIFDDLPSEAEMREAEKMPCDECAGHAEPKEDAPEELAEHILKDDQSDHKG